MKFIVSGKGFAFGGAINGGPGATTHKGGHLRELRAAKKRARRKLREYARKEEKDERAY